MPIEITMPALSPTMEEGNLLKWLVKEGDVVQSGQVLAEIETDKATMEFEAVDEGTVGALLVAAGTEAVKVGTPIMTLLGEGEAAGSAAPATPMTSTPPAAPAPAAPAGAPVAVASAPAPAVARSAPAGDHGRLFASPLARRLAAQNGIDLARVSGSGPGGRIVKADIDALLAGGSPATAAPLPAPAVAPASTAAAPRSAASPAAAPAATGQAVDVHDHAPPAGVPFEEVRLSGMRKVIARRMTESKTQVPHFYMSIDVALDRLLATRKELNAILGERGIKVSVNDFIIRACGLALAQVPDANAMFAGDRILRFQRADISVAVAVPGGLVTPVIRGADTKGLAAISAEMADLAARAREGKLLPEDYQGGTFSISNLGMHGIRQFDAVINPPQGAILAVGAGEPRPVVRDGALAIATQMTVTLSVDHRVLDGAIGADFLNAFRRLIEEPLLMMA